ncbi:uncharacterized protein LOC141724290 [Apium graveolens]|uniref:uncharacterized protein LOC141724290 n=1 Tax=Apium graveolens TaxID=4045 RepID=UPI003D7AB704
MSMQARMSMEAHGRCREVRRVHIIYFISRKGRIEQPHLLRVHHFCGTEVRLRDIKRWLAVVRGEDMPESFSWSYKRRYKTGYVWQDSLDEDLITPISDNEYVIKGSQFCCASSSTSTIDDHEESSNVEANKCNNQDSEATQMDNETKQLRDIHEAPITTPINDSTKDEEETKHLISRNEENCSMMKKKRNDVFFLNFLKKNKSKKFQLEIQSHEMADQSAASKLICSTKKKEKKNTRSLLRRVITCGMVDDRDSAMKAMREASDQ